MRNNAALIYNICLVVGDFLALVVAFLVAYVLRVKYQIGIAPEDIGPSNGKAFLGAFLGLVPFWIIIFSLLGLYNSSIYEKRFVEFGRLLMGSFVGLLFVVFWSFMSSEPLFPARLVPVYGFVFSFVFLVLFRNIARLVRTQLFTFNVGLTKVLIVGNTLMSRELINWLAQSHKSGYHIVGVIGGKESVGNYAVPLYRSFASFMHNNPPEFHGIIQTELYANESRNEEILTYAQKHHISYRFVPGNTELFVGNISVELFRSSIPVIAVHQTPLFGWGRVVKRLTDLFLASVALILATPLMGAIALLVRLTSGSVFFRQKRLTRYNKVFTVYKFRSQYKKYDGTTPEQAFTLMGKPELITQYRQNGDRLPNDPRITPLGRFLRSTSLDELPQLFNVLRGDISLVGPRALIPEELAKFKNRHTILSVKSGLTGLAQVSGRREISFEERRTLDIYYVQNWSLWLDLVIIAKTIRSILGGRGAN